MAITLYYRSTTGHVGTLGTTGNFDLETTTGTTASQSFSANTPRTYVYYSATTFPNLTDWATGDYTWYLDVTTANANVQLTTVKVSRYNSALNSELASGSASPNLTLSTTGLKTGTVSFASPNPGGRAASDRLVITLTFSKLAGGGAQAINADVNGSADSRIDTPLVIPTIRDISEGSVSVSETVTTQESYIRPISDEPSVSSSDSIEGTKIPGESAAAVYSVHFVEFPEEVTDSLYVPAPQQIEQVSTTKTHKYNVIGKVTTTKTHKYDVLAKITRTRIHLFNIIQQIIRTRTHKYNVIGKIVQTKTHKYNIIQKIVQTRTHKFNIIQQVIATKTHKYDLASALTHVTQTLTHKYNIIGKITVTKTHLFNILQKVTATKTHKFNVLQRVTQTKTHKYNVIARVSTTKTHKYSITQQILRTRTHKYNLAGRVTSTKTHKYDIAGVVTQISTTKTHIFSVIARIAQTRTHKFNILQQIVRTRTHKYNVIGKITLIRTHKFNIVQKLTVLKTHKYNLLNRVTPDRIRTHKYNILTLVTRTRTHKYNIIGRITRTRTHRYQMGGRVLVSKAHRFVVGFGGTLGELGGSTNAVVRFPERVQIIDIVADLNNLAISNVEIPVARPPANIVFATVVIAEYSSKLLTAAVHKPRHRIASRQIIPQVIDTIDNLAVAPYIGIEVLPQTKQSRLQLNSQVLLTSYNKILVSSLTQLKQDEKTKIKIASATMLQQTQETVIESKAQLEMLPFSSLPVILAPEIMTRQKEKILKTLIRLLSSDDLFE